MNFQRSTVSMSICLLSSQSSCSTSTPLCSRDALSNSVRSCSSWRVWRGRSRGRNCRGMKDRSGCVSRKKRIRRESLRSLLIECAEMTSSSNVLRSRGRNWKSSKKKRSRRSLSKVYHVLDTTKPLILFPSLPQLLLSFQHLFHHLHLHLHHQSHLLSFLFQQRPSHWLHLIYFRPTFLAFQSLPNLPSQRQPRSTQFNLSPNLFQLNLSPLSAHLLLIHLKISQLSTLIS